MRHGLVLCGVTALLPGCVGEVERGAPPEVRRDDSGCLRGRRPPELVSSPLHWVSSQGRVTLAGLRGRVVWLQFNF